MRRVVALGLAALLASGCYTHAKAPGASLKVMREAPLSGDIVLDHAKGNVPWGVVRFDPATAIRFRVGDKWSPWLPAGELTVSDDGIVFGNQSRGWADVAAVTARGLTDDDLAGFAACVPPRGADGWVVLSGTPDAISQALRCVYEAQAKLGLGVPGRWDVRFADKGVRADLTYDELAQSYEQGFTSTAGLRFDDIAEVEVANFNASQTALTVVLATVVVAAGLVLVGAAIGAGGRGCGNGNCGNGGCNGLDDPKSNAPATVRPNSPAVVAGLGGAAPSSTNVRRLFTESEGRRSTARLLGTVDVMTQLDAFKTVSLTPLFGVRLGEVLEVAGGFSLYWGDPLRATPVQNAPLGVPQSPAVPDVMPTVRLLANLELDPWRRMSLPLGIDVAMGLSGQVQVRVRFGLRLRLWYVRLGFYPFNPTYSDGLGTLTAPWTFPSTFEAGVEW